jgi:hypothetical protein
VHYRLVHGIRLVRQLHERLVDRIMQWLLSTLNGSFHGCSIPYSLNWSELWKLLHLLARRLVAFDCFKNRFVETFVEDQNNIFWLCMQLPVLIIKLALVK